MKDFDLRKYLSENPLLEDTSTSEDFLGLLMEITIENYCEENNILRENLNENFLKKLKSGIKDLSSKAKNRAKSAIDKIKTVTSDPKQALKDLSKIQKLYLNSSTEDFIKDLQYAVSLSNKPSLEEADQGSFTDMEQITGLEGGDTFTWNGENQSSQYVNVKVENSEDEKQGVLIPGKTYTKIDKLDIDGAGKDRTVIYLTSIDQKEFEKDEKRKTLLGFFGKYPKMKNLVATLMMTLGIFSVASGLTGDTPFESSATFQNNFIELVQDGDIDSILPDPDNTVTLGGPFPTDGENSTNDNVVDKVSNSLDKANVDLGDTNLDNTDDNNAAVQTHDVGEYNISDAEKEAIVKNLVEETLEDLNNQIDKLKGKVINSIDLDIDFGGVVSNQGDADSNKADDGTDLIKGRSDTAEDIAKKAGEQLTKIIKNTLGDDVKVNINYDLVDTHNSYENQVEEEARDEMGTQSSFETITVKGIDAVKAETNETPPDLMYNYLFDPQNPPSKIPTKPTPDPTPSPKEKGVDIAKTDNFDNMNRHNQIAVILGQISPSLDIYDKLESEGIKSELTGQLDDILKNEKASNELKKLAKLIVTIRKSPNAFLKKVAKATGVEFSIRAKAKMTGFGKKGKSAAKLGLTETVLQSLKEGIIDDMIKDEDITAKKIDIIALLGSMYKSNSQKDGKRLSVLDQSKLSDEDKSKLKGIGFSTDEKSGKYMFMDDDEYKEFEKNKEKTKTTSTTKSTDDEFVNDPKLFAIEDRMEKLKALQIDFKQLDQTQEIDPFILGILSFVNPKFENDKNILKRVLQKALKQIKDNNRKQKQNIANQLKSESNIKQVNEDVKKTNKQVQKAIQTIANDSQLPRRINALTKFDDIVDLLVKIFFDQDDPDKQFFPGTSFPELEQGFLRAIRALDNDKDIQSSFDKNKTKGKEDEDKGLDVFTKTYLSKKDVASQITTEQIKSLIKNIITEGLTPSQTAKVKDKYKQIYSGMLKGDKKKLLKYIDPKFGRPNPDGMATGRAINLVKKEKDENVEESKTEKQRKWACAQVDSKSRPKGLSKAQAKEMCSDTNLSKNESMENVRLTELIKTALKGPVKEGYYGTSDIENVAESLGYDDLNHFFNDNPGAVEVLTSWIENIPEFRKSLENDFSNQELEELGFYNLDGYDTDDDDDDIEESFPDLTGDGKVTKADILKGRGVELKERIFKELRGNINEEMSDLIRDLKSSLGFNNSRRDVEEYLGYTLDNYKLQALKRARIIR